MNHWYAGAAPPFVGVAVNVTVSPTHISVPEDETILTDTGKFGLTVTVTFAVPEQPGKGSVPVIVYVDVAAGLAVTVAPVVALKPPAGDHV